MKTATSKVELSPGDRVRFSYPSSERRRWWDVRIADDRFVILTRQADFKPKGDKFYTIIDWERDLRGPCDLIGQGWARLMTDEECAALLRALNAYLELKQKLADAHGRPVAMEETTVEVSYRNNVRIQISDVLRRVQP